MKAIESALGLRAGHPFKLYFAFVFDPDRSTAERRVVVDPLAIEYILKLPILDEHGTPKTTLTVEAHFTKDQIDRLTPQGTGIHIKLLKKPPPRLHTPTLVYDCRIPSEFTLPIEPVDLAMMLDRERASAGFSVPISSTDVWMRYGDRKPRVKTALDFMNPSGLLWPLDNPALVSMSRIHRLADRPKKLHPAYAHAMEILAGGEQNVKVIRALIKKQGLPVPSIGTIYNWLGAERIKANRG